MGRPSKKPRTQNVEHDPLTEIHSTGPSTSIQIPEISVTGPQSLIAPLRATANPNTSESPSMATPEPQYTPSLFGGYNSLAEATSQLSVSDEGEVNPSRQNIAPLQRRGRLIPQETEVQGPSERRKAHAETDDQVQVTLRSSNRQQNADPTPPRANAHVNSTRSQGYQTSHADTDQKPPARADAAYQADNMLHSIDEVPLSAPVRPSRRVMLHRTGYYSVAAKQPCTPCDDNVDICFFPDSTAPCNACQNLGKSARECQLEKWDKMTLIPIPNPHPPPPNPVPPSTNVPSLEFHTYWTPPPTPIPVPSLGPVGVSILSNLAIPPHPNNARNAKKLINSWSSSSMSRSSGASTAPGAELTPIPRDTVQMNTLVGRNAAFDEVTAGATELWDASVSDDPAPPMTINPSYLPRQTRADIQRAPDLRGERSLPRGSDPDYEPPLGVRDRKSRPGHRKAPGPKDTPDLAPR